MEWGRPVTSSDWEMIIGSCWAPIDARRGRDASDRGQLEISRKLAYYEFDTRRTRIIDSGEDEEDYREAKVLLGDCEVHWRYRVRV